MRIHFYFIVFGLVILPKMYTPSLDFVAGIWLWFRRQHTQALSAMNSSLRGFVAAWLEILTTPLVYMPDILHSPLRLWRAMKCLIVGQAAWKVQAQVERETQCISFMTSLKKTWIYPMIALGFTFALWLLEVPGSILLIAMLATWLVFPVTIWLGARPMSARQRNSPFLLWLLKDFDSDRIRGSESSAVSWTEGRRSLIDLDKADPQTPVSETFGEAAAASGVKFRS